MILPGATPALRATAPHERAPLPDVARGLALLGILCVNAQDFASYAEWKQVGADRVAQVIIDVFLNGKAVSLFAMLFGAGAALLLGRGGTVLLCRRLMVLLVVGTLHYVLVWHGDIIANYAVVGLGLLLLLRLAPYVLATAGALLTGGWCAWVAWQAWQTQSGVQRGFFAVLDPGQSWPSLVAQRAHEFPSLFFNVLNFDWAWLLGLFCLGAALQRAGVLWRPAEHRRTLRLMRLWGLGLGWPISLGLAYCNTLSGFSADLWGLAARSSGGLLVALGYLGALGLGHTLGPLRHFAASGRMAMSNYFAQSIVMTTLFYPYGLNLYGRWGAASALSLALVLGLLQVWLSTLYLRRFSAGPAEYLVRRIIYPQRKTP